MLKPDIIKKSNGAIIAFVGIIFLARGFVDVENRITDLYDAVFAYFDLPIAIIAFILLVFVIYSILVSARNSENEYKLIKHSINEGNFEKSNLNKVHHSKKHDDFDYEDKSHDVKSNHKKINKSRHNVEKGSEVTFKNHIDQKSGINQSSGNIQFESNDLLDDYKK